MEAFLGDGFTKAFLPFCVNAGKRLSESGLKCFCSCIDAATLLNEIGMSFKLRIKKNHHEKTVDCVAALAFVTNVTLRYSLGWLNEIVEGQWHTE